MNIQQLRAQIAALQDATMDENRNFTSTYDEGKFDALSAVDALLDSLQEEPVSEDFKKFEVEYMERERDNIVCVYDRHAGLVDGAQWQKEQMMKDAFECEVKVDAGGYPYIDRCIELYDYDKDVPLAKAGKKVKVIVIKED